MFGNRITTAISLAALGGGAMAIGVQTLLLREFLSVFSGNELVTGLMLCFWMLLTALGAYGGSRIRFSQGLIIGWFSILSVIPYLTIFCIDYFRNALFGPGVMIPLGGILCCLLIGLSPFCLISGALFPLLVKSTKTQDSPATQQVYTLEALGSLLGGIGATVCMLFICDSFISIALFGIIGLSASVLLSVADKKWKFATIPVIALLILISIVILLPAQMARRALYPGQEAVVFTDAPQANLAITRQQEQLSFFSDGNLLFCTSQQQQDEEPLYFARLQRRQMNEMLVIGGHASAVQDLSNNLKKIKFTFLEEDPVLLQLQQEYTTLQQSDRLRLVSSDARSFLKNCTPELDALILNVSEPSTLAANRFYTKEFFRIASSSLSDSGVFMISLPSSANYLGRDARAIHATLYQTLKTEFAHVLIIPASRDYFLASSKPVYSDIAQRSTILDIRSTYVNPDYIDDVSMGFKRDQLMKQIEMESPVNSDLQPVSSKLAIQAWLSISGKGTWIILIILFVILCIPLVTGKTEGAGLWITGFTGTATEVALLYFYQTQFGNLYIVTGLIFGIFMAGLALGSALLKTNQSNLRKQMQQGQWMIVVLCFLLPGFFALTQAVPLPTIITKAIVLLFAFILAFFGGRQFVLFAASAVARKSSTSAGIAYGTDMAGAAAAALCVGLWLLPEFGMLWVTSSVALLNLLMLALMTVLRNRLRF